MGADLVGWSSAALLLASLIRQVYVQWHSDSVAGLSKWLFRGQIAASIGFVIYSYLVENWVFVVTNFAIGLIAVVGQARFWHKARRVAKGAAEASPGESGRPTARKAAVPRTRRARSSRAARQTRG